VLGPVLAIQVVLVFVVKLALVVVGDIDGIQGVRIARISILVKFQEHVFYLVAQSASLFGKERNCHAARLIIVACLVNGPRDTLLLLWLIVRIIIVAAADASGQPQTTDKRCNLYRSTRSGQPRCRVGRAVGRKKSPVAR